MLITMWSTSTESHPKFRDMAIALCIITSTQVSPTKSRTRSVASVNCVPSMVFMPSPKKSMHNIGNVRKRSLVRIRSRPALVPIPTPLVNLWAGRKKASHPWAALPSLCPHPTRLLRNQARLPSSRTSSAKMASSPQKNASAGSTRTCACSVAVVVTRPKNA